MVLHSLLDITEPACDRAAANELLMAQLPSSYSTLAACRHDGLAKLMALTAGFYMVVRTKTSPVGYFFRDSPTSLAGPGHLPP
jgi:hypothetical protein